MAKQPTIEVGIEAVDGLPIIGDIATERIRQRETYDAAHDDRFGADDWQALRFRYERQVTAMNRQTRRTALVKLAALCVAEIEAIDRAAA